MRLGPVMVGPERVRPRTGPPPLALGGGRVALLDEDGVRIWSTARPNDAPRQVALPAASGVAVHGPMVIAVSASKAVLVPPEGEPTVHAGSFPGARVWVRGDDDGTVLVDDLRWSFEGRARPVGQAPAPAPVALRAGEVSAAEVGGRRAALHVTEAPAELPRWRVVVSEGTRTLLDAPLPWPLRPNQARDLQVALDAGEPLVAVGGDGRVAVWDLRSGELVLSSPPPPPRSS